MPLIQSGLILPQEIGNITPSQAAVVAADNVTGGLMVMYRINVPAGAGTTDVIITNQTRIFDAWFSKVNAGGAGDTLTVQNAANAITNAMSTNVADNAEVRAANINDANYQIAAGGTLRIVTAGAADVGCRLYVLGLRT